MFASLATLSNWWILGFYVISLPFISYLNCKLHFCFILRLLRCELSATVFLIPHLLTLIHPCVDYSYIHGIFSALCFLKRCVIKISPTPLLTVCFQPFPTQLKVAPISVLWRQCYLKLSSDLANYIPCLLPRPRRIKLHSLILFCAPRNARVSQCLQFFIPFTAELWDSLHASVFSPIFDMIFFFNGKIFITSQTLDNPFSYTLWRPLHSVGLFTVYLLLLLTRAPFQ